MLKDSTKPSIYRIVSSDYTSTLSVVMIIVVWGMYIATNYYGYFPGTRGRSPLTEEDAPFFKLLGFAATLIGISLLGWRIRFFNQLFECGEEVSGHLTKVTFWRDRGKLEYDFAYQNQKYSSKNTIHQSKRTKFYQTGDEIVLIVNPEKPTQAVIKDIYQ